MGRSGSSPVKMKAVVFLSIFLVASCSCHSIQRRSLLGGRGHGAGHHAGHHGAHNGGHHGGHHRGHHGNHGGENRRKSGNRASPQIHRFGRDGDHTPLETSPISDSYLPGSDYDYEAEDRLAGYSPDQVGQYERDGELGQYQREGGLGEYDASGQGQYDGELDSEASALVEAKAEESSEVSSDSEDTTEEESSGEEGYSAPRQGEEGYSAPGEEQESRAGEEEYSAPDQQSQYGEDEQEERVGDTYGAPETGYSANGFPFSSVEAAGKGGVDGVDTCPGDSLESCVEVCPGTTARVYGVCVGGCAARCEE